MVNQAISSEAPDTSDLDARLTGTLSISAQELILEIVDSHKPQIPKDAFTLKQFTSITGMKRETARTLLSSNVDSGKLLTTRPLRNGPRYWWRNIDNP